MDQQPFRSPGEQPSVRRVLEERQAHMDELRRQVAAAQIQMARHASPTGRNHVGNLAFIAPFIVFAVLSRFVPAVLALVVAVAVAAVIGWKTLSKS